MAGDQVLRSTKNLSLKFAARKLVGLCKFVGLFEVLETAAHSTAPNVLWLKTPRQFKIHMPVHVKDIKGYRRREDKLGGPPEEMLESIVIDGEDCYQVEEKPFWQSALPSSQKKTRKRKVLVKWLGLDLLSATWEPMANIAQCLLDEFRVCKRMRTTHIQTPMLTRLGFSNGRARGVFSVSLLSLVRMCLLVCLLSMRACFL